MTIAVLDPVETRFPDLQIETPVVSKVTVTKEAPELEKVKRNVVASVRSDHDLEDLREDPLVRAYRDFFWALDLDPTKTRPASEALIRRVLQGQPFPRINTLVDACNLASLSTGVPIAAFDAHAIAGEMVMRFASGGESFLGIGMEAPTRLDGGELIIADAEKLLAIYPHRNAQVTKVTRRTAEVHLLVCGAPAVPEAVLTDARDTVLTHVKLFCDGFATQDR